MRALVLGCTGLVGRAIAAELAVAGWRVTGTGRSAARFPPGLARAGVHFLESDRHADGSVAAVVGDGADLVVDCLCYTAEHARQVLAHQDSLAQLVMISTKAVYVDAHGRHSNSADAPDFGAPVTEQQPVLPADRSGEYLSRDGYGANKVAAEQVVLSARIPVTVLRPSRIHGVGTARPREWFFVRRLLDGRTRVPLAHDARTANHPSAARNVAALTRACVASPATRILNAADPDAPTAGDIARAVAAACRRPLEVVGLPDFAPPELGRSPWGTWPPYLLDTSASQAVPGYDPLDYAYAVPAAVDWLLTLRPDQRAALDEDPYFADLFDYLADDRGLASVE